MLKRLVIVDEGMLAEHYCLNPSQNRSDLMLRAFVEGDGGHGEICQVQKITIMDGIKPIHFSRWEIVIKVEWSLWGKYPHP